MEKIDLKSLDKEGLDSFFKSKGLPPFRAKQVVHWIYERGATSIQEITELSKDLRAKLSETATISSLKLKKRLASVDGTEKYLFGLSDGNSIESVLIPDGKRLTLCISSQVGCQMGCKFCLTGSMGFIRNLEPREIVDQVLSIKRLITPGEITNIVLMGMGEPLNNFENVSQALQRLTKWAGFSKRKITLSTSGIAPEILNIPKKAPNVNLAVSLNATTDEIRSRIMPVNRKYPLYVLLPILKKYPVPARSRITFEYVLLGEINDSIEDAKRLIALLRGIPSKINLIPFNEFEGAEFSAPSDERVLQFQKKLVNAGMTAPVRKSRGKDILAACGQLRATYKGKKTTKK